MNTYFKTAIAVFGSAAVATLGLTSAALAEFPEKNIEFIIPFGAGGGADIEGRLLAVEMAKILGVNIVPINKVGGGGAVTYTYVKNAKPDGYTIGWNSTSLLTTTNIGNVDFSYDALDQVGRVEWQPMPLVVKAGSKFKTFADFVKECKANPGKLKVSNGGTGSGTHLAAISLLTAAGCEVTHLPVGVKRRNSSVLSGEADAYVGSLTGAINLSKAGKLKVLVLTTDSRNSVMPDVPTAKELGYNVVLDLFRGLSVPKGTPDAIKAKLFDAMAKAAKSEVFMALAKKKGFTIDPMSAADFEAFLKTEDAKVIAIMKGAGLYQSKNK